MFSFYFSLCIVSVKLDHQESGMSKSVMIGIVLGSIACLITESLATVVLFDVKRTKYKNEVLGRQSSEFFYNCHDPIYYYLLFFYGLGIVMLFSFNSSENSN